MTYVWAYLAGTLTLINPCVLPLLPVIIAAAFQGSRVGPLMLAAGLTLSFAVLGVGVTAFGHLAGIDELLINRTAAVVMVLFGDDPARPRAHRRRCRASYRRSRAAPTSGSTGSGGAGAGGQLAVGMLLGAVWSPCIGPTLGGAIGLAASGENLGQAGATMLAFGIGVSTVLLGLAYGSREILMARRERLMAWMPWAKPIMGAALLLVGLAVFFHLDRIIESRLLDAMPDWLLTFSVAV